MEAITGPTRVEGRAKVTGTARYTGDFAHDELEQYLHVGEVAPTLLHASAVLSTIAKGRVTALDVAAAEALPGVVAVVTHRNAPRLKKTSSLLQTELSKYLPLQDEAVHYRGQCIALIVAESADVARHAASLVTATYTEEKPFIDFVGNRALAKPEKKVGAGAPGHKETGKPQAEYDAAMARVDATYTTDATHHNAMEPGAALAYWHAPSKDPVRLTCIATSQFAYGDAIFLGTAFGLGMNDGMLRLGMGILLGAQLNSKVRVVAPLIGGGFGGKGGNAHIVLAALAAKHAGHPVRFVLERSQTFSMMPYRSATEQRVRLGSSADGKIAALLHESLIAAAGTGSFVEAPGEVSGRLYDIANVLLDHKSVKLDMNAPGFMRAPGIAPGQFGVESALDELAHALRVDPIELRLRNYSAKDAESGKQWSSKQLRECYAAGAEAIGWADRSPAPAAVREGPCNIGYGMATAMYPTNQFPTAVCITLSSAGSARVEVSAHEIGQGAVTVLSMIAAEALGLPIERVHLLFGDTTLPLGFVAGGSSTTLSAGEAILSAAKKAVKLRDSNASLPITVKAVAGRTFGHSKYGRAAFGAQFARVAVDSETGKIRVTHMAGAFAAGRILNPRLARSQYLGGMVMGLGQALLEQTTVDLATGQWINNNLAEAHVPSNADVPEISVRMVDEDDSRGSKLAAKGIGEIGITGVSAAIANAIFNATGKRLRHLPMTADHLMS